MRQHERGPKILIAIAAVVVVGYFMVEATLLAFDVGFPLDDSWIHLQFARNLAAGNGLAYNEELVTGSTAPLWTALLSLLFLLPGNLVFWVKLLGSVLFAAGAVATYRLARELDVAEGLSTLAGLLTLATYWLVWSALSGMEIPLFILVSLWGMILHIRERRDVGRPPVSLFLFGISILLRPEAALLVVLALFDRLLVLRRTADGDLALAPLPWRSIGYGLVLAAMALVPTMIFFYFVGGSFLPTTFGAKTGSTRNWLPNAQYLYTVVGILIRPQPLTFLAAGAGCLRLVERLGTSRDRGLLPALWLIGLPLAYSFLTPEGRHILVGNFGRYYFPLFPPLIVLGVLGLERGLDAIGSSWRLGPVRLPVRALAIALLLVPTVLTLVKGAAFYAQNVANIQDGDVEMGRWLREHVDPRAVLAVQDIGAIKFFAGHRIVDLVGIVSPEVRPYIKAAAGPHDPYGEAGVFRYLQEQRPDYVVAFPEWHPNITGNRELFTPVFRLDVRESMDNITLAGPVLMVYTTPWTRYPLRAS